jgi:hypothetical protein
MKLLQPDSPRRKHLRGVFVSFLGLALLLPAPLLAQQRDTTSILEEQEMLRRKLQLLKRTMEALIPRLEKEGRRALDLLREGLSLLDKRGDDSGQLTIEELMDRARDDVQAGQVATSIQRQEQVISHLERLLSVLMDREDVTSLEKSLADLKAMREGIEALRGEEQKLREDTQKLREESANQAQRALEEQLSKLTKDQRELLDRNEQAGRASGALALEQIERELEALLARQKIDREVLESWKPESSGRLDEATAALDAARREAARAERLARAAEELQQAAEAAKNPPAGGEDPAAKLDEDAAREERQQRVSNDESAAKAAEALRKASSSLRQAGTDANARQKAAAEAEAKAAELAAEAQQRRAEAQAARGRGEGARGRRSPASSHRPAVTGRDGSERSSHALEQGAARREGSQEAAKASDTRRRRCSVRWRTRSGRRRVVADDGAQTAERPRGLALPTPKPAGEERIARLCSVQPKR